MRSSGRRVSDVARAAGEIEAVANAEATLFELRRRPPSWTLGNVAAASALREVGGGVEVERSAPLLVTRFCSRYRACLCANVSISCSLELTKHQHLVADRTMTLTGGLNEAYKQISNAK